MNEDGDSLDPANLLPYSKWLIEPTLEDLAQTTEHVYITVDPMGKDRPTY